MVQTETAEMDELEESDAAPRQSVALPKAEATRRRPRHLDMTASEREQNSHPSATKDAATCLLPFRSRSLASAERAI